MDIDTSMPRTSNIRPESAPRLRWPWQVLSSDFVASTVPALDPSRNKRKGTGVKPTCASALISTGYLFFVIGQNWDTGIQSSDWVNFSPPPPKSKSTSCLLYQGNLHGHMAYGASLGPQHTSQPHLGHHCTPALLMNKGRRD